MPGPAPQSSHDDVVRVARNREDRVTIRADRHRFGVHPMTLHKWMRQADVDEGTKPGRVGPKSVSCGTAVGGSVVGTGERGPASGRNLHLS